MGLQTVLEAAYQGYGTTRLNGAGPLADAALTALLTIPTTVSGADIQVITGPIYYENDGTAADATTTQVNGGETLRIRNARALLSTLHLYAPGAYDIRVTLWG